VAAAGEEITFDYGEEYFELFFKEAGCHRARYQPRLVPREPSGDGAVTITT
jgi:hypothetical protein